MEKPTFILDGNNIAFKNGKTIQLKRILALNEEVEKLGSTLIIVSHELRYRVDNKVHLEQLIDNQTLLESPKGVDCDLYLLESAKQIKGVVISNDQFRQYRKQYFDELDTDTRY